MPIEGWKPLRLGDVIDIRHGYAFQGEYFAEEPPGDILLTPGNFAIGGGFKRDKYKYYRGLVPQEFVLRAGDLLVTMTDLSKESDTLGYPAFVPDSNTHRFLHNQRLGKVVELPGAQVDLRFLYYLLCTSKYRHEVLASATGTTVKHTSPRRILSYKFECPPLHEQQAIGSMLVTLDDKIELNHRMNETLAELAQSLFKSWFVAATQNGTPQGWSEGVIDDSIEILSGGTPKTSVAEYWDGDIPWYSVEDAPAESDVFVIDTKRHITQTGVENSATQIFPAGTTIISARGTVGKLAIAAIPMAMNQSCYAVRGIDGYPPFFTYFHLRKVVADLRQQTHGTVFETITRQTFTTVKAFLPPAKLAQEFDQRIEPFMNRIRTNLFESRTLAALRDALLPKLFSGELRIPSLH